MIPGAFEYYAPASVSEAAELLDEHKDKEPKLLAGGHSLIPLMKLRLAQPQVLIDLGKIKELRYIREEGDDLVIGAMTPYEQIAGSVTVKRRAIALAEAAGMVADPQVRNMGTIGGSVAHADPAGDLPAVMMALNAKFSATSHGLILGIGDSHRDIQADNFFVDLLTTTLDPDEVLTEITFPKLPPRTGTAYCKFGNKASHYAIVGIAAAITVDTNGICREARIGITGSGPKAVRAKEAEEVLVGNAVEDTTIESAAKMTAYGIDFNEDIHASAEYREHLTSVIAERAIRKAVSRAS